jgi:hypothetical protein
MIKNMDSVKFNGPMAEYTKDNGKTVVNTEKENIKGETVFGNKESGRTESVC